MIDEACGGMLIADVPVPSPPILLPLECCAVIRSTTGSYFV